MSFTWIVAACLAGQAGTLGFGSARDAYVAKDDPLGEPVEKVVYLDQGWLRGQSIFFYFTSQGSQIIPYDWFLALEQGDSDALFRSNQNMLKFRYLPQLPDPILNPDGLPVGFVGGDGTSRKWLGLTCAACHTNEIRYQNVGYRVDGAPTHGDVRALLASLVYAMQRTLADPAKFDRFAGKVLGKLDGAGARSLLQAQLRDSIQKRVEYNLRNFPGYDPSRPPPPPTDYGRLDAVGAIVNEVYHHAVASPQSPTENTRPATAPVSYPFLWDTPQQELEQWIGIAKSGGPLDVLSLARNVGEVIGVFADFTIPAVPNSLGFASSVKILNLQALELGLKALWSPQWPADFPPIDTASAAKGKALYERLNCASCHTIVTDRKNPLRTVISKMTPVQTDPLAYLNFFNRTGSSGKLEGLNVNLIPFTQTIPATAGASMMVTNVVAGTIVGSLFPMPPDALPQITFGVNRGHPIEPADVAATVMYKARPLDGIWATAPYLHNGSVPNLDELFLPTSQRSKSFSIGVRTFDPVKVGFETNVPGFPRFSVEDDHGHPIPGNSNAGHEGEAFGTNLNPDERRWMVDYLKTL